MQRDPEPRRAGVYGVRAAPGTCRVPAGAMSAARAREMGPGAAAPWPTSVSDRMPAYIAPKKNKTTLLMGADRGALARVRQGHNRAGTRGIWGAGAAKWARKRDRRHDDGKFGSRVARPHTAAGGRSRFSPSKIGRKQTSSQNGQNALKDDVRATDQKPILTAAGARVRYHVPLGDNVDRDGLKEGWNHDCGAAARAS